MIVSVFGKQFVKLQYGDLTIAVNPEADGKTKFGADIMLSSLTHPDMHGIEMVTYGGRVPFVIDGPGSYELQEIPVIGVGSWTEYEGQKMYNTSYVTEIEGRRLIFLGHISDMDALSAEAREQLGEADIVFVALGAGLPPSKVYNLAKSFSPSYVVAVGDAAQDDVVRKVFMDEANQEMTKPLDKWTVKPKDLIGKEAEIIVISS